MRPIIKKDVFVDYMLADTEDLLFFAKGFRKQLLENNRFELSLVDLLEFCQFIPIDLFENKEELIKARIVENGTDITDCSNIRFID